MIRVLLLLAATVILSSIVLSTIIFQLQQQEVANNILLRELHNSSINIDKQLAANRFIILKTITGHRNDTN